MEASTIHVSTSLEIIRIYKSYIGMYNYTTGKGVSRSKIVTAGSKRLQNPYKSRGWFITDAGKDPCLGVFSLGHLSSRISTTWGRRMCFRWYPTNAWMTQTATQQWVSCNWGPKPEVPNNQRTSPLYNMAAALLSPTNLSSLQRWIVLLSSWS